MIGNHPTVGQIDIFLKLDGDHFCVCLYDHAFEPPADAFIFIVIMVTKNFNHVPDLKYFILLGRTCET